LTDLAEAEEGGSGDGTTVEFLIAFGVAAFESMVQKVLASLSRQDSTPKKKESLRAAN
jgi:hypothetical protein